MDISALGRLILIFAVALLIIGLLILGIGRVTGGRWLPGDIVFHRDGVTIYFPIITSIVISIILSLLLTFIFWLVGRGR